MGALENRIPPPLVATLIGVLMGGSVRYLPGFELTLGWRLAIALPVLLLGLGVCLAGVLSFHHARTTVNPLRPEKASALVDGGIYQHTRNPMYLGFATALVGEYKKPEGEQKRYAVEGRDFDLGHGDVVIAAITASGSIASASIIAP